MFRKHYSVHTSAVFWAGGRGKKTRARRDSGVFDWEKLWGDSGAWGGSGANVPQAFSAHQKCNTSLTGNSEFSHYFVTINHMVVHVLTQRPC